jgi:hypothetical protein
MLTLHVVNGYSQLAMAQKTTFYFRSGVGTFRAAP